MTQTLLDPRFRLRCRGTTCGNDFRIFGLRCKNCGFVAATVRSADPDSDEFVALCESCQSVLAADRRPDACSECGNSDAGWWDHRNACWHQPDLAPLAYGAGYWVSGEFEGEIGGRPGAIKLGKGYNRKRLKGQFMRGSLKSVRREMGPRLVLENDEAPPLRSELAQEVRFFYGPSESASVVVTLHDIRLHHWREVAVDEFNEPASGVFRVQGRAYAYLYRSPEVPPTRTEVLPVEVVVPTRAPEPEPEVVERDAPAPLIPLPVVTPSCVSCSWLLHLVLTAVIGLVCEWPLALLAVLGLARMVCWLDALNERQARKIRGPELPWTAIPLLLSLTGVFLLWSGANSANCPPSLGWGLALVSLGLFIGTLFRTCWLKVLLLLLWVLAVQVHFSGNSNLCAPMQAATNTVSTNNLPPQVPGALTPFPETLTPAPVPATPSRVEPFKEAIDHIKQAANNLANRIKDKLYFDPSSSAVNELLENAPDGRRITIDLALAKPELLGDCKTSVYLPNESMFALYSDQLNPAVLPQLDKLDLLKTTYPDRDIVIIGHADKVGNDSPDGVFNNIMLSERRAAAVATWLGENTQWGLNNIEVQGAGSKFPIVDLPGDAAINRRVEFRLKCKK